MPLIGGTCEKDDDCPIANTYCYEVCKCRVGLEPAEDNTYCKVNTTRIGDSCKGDDCNSIGNAICKEVKESALFSSLKEEENTRFKCKCKPDHYQLGNTCAKFAKGLADKCEDRIGCARIHGSRCDKVSKTCQCLEKYFYQVEDVCFKKAKGLGNQCKNDNGCTKIENAECLDYTCHCKEKFYNWKGVCYKYADGNGKVTLKCRAQHNGSLQLGRHEFPLYNKCNFDHDGEVLGYDSFEVLVDNSL
ncbi:hypothetical protein KQX54_003419 [Cotesia glomerata]|uniref:EB domain-containing protein n=1 Tax=Cotesia glomerata TaxID=32391 RepID=A0AAV7IHR7_COTGL|nr:hypothetical protein KQX54_003419 [Cotesia glomerata]